ncbi:MULTISPECIES: ribulose-phosphate 3-epimerase [Mammaliicoccus]|uniref:ribulose-phosphate 3-epimerase n=1 Tax=Mammaliicoccus TaxID=2803850 RepID=UPI000E68C20A|nr:MULTISPECIES: ribulose-phosphate 3-epimerase [Mammaliicoccus]RIO17951.1 ribulose-phosphate 3-epimerase [Mammaliicoccus sciuri]
MKDIILSPSIMCGDLINLEKSINEIEQNGLNNLHIDVIDGSFSPSMPLGLDTIKALRKKTNLNFDVHIMSDNNEFFINEIINIGAESITFHLESSKHIDRYIKLIKESGSKVGVALNPSTPLSSLEYVIDQIDMVCLMLINPGFATNKNEKQVTYANRKVSDLKNMIDERDLDVSIQVDGRVSMETIYNLVSSGADNLVLGSTSLFLKGHTLSENKNTILGLLPNI